MGKAPNHKKVHKAPFIWAKDIAKVNKNKYPHCRGTFPDCPDIINPDEVAHVCKMCPIYDIQKQINR